jgi:hypothetical protein
MDRWAGALYGDPCRECSFAFSIGLDSAVEYVAGVPEGFSELVRGATGAERHPDLTWSVSSYVCHVADNLRIWAERLAGSARGARSIGPYDENLLAAARGYPDIPLVASLWSLRRSRDDWLSAVGEAPRDGIVLIHPARGEMALEDIARANAHDSFHHAWDIQRTIGASPRNPPSDL